MYFLSSALSPLSLSLSTSIGSLGSVFCLHKAMQYSCLLAQCSTQPSNGGRAVKAASVGSSIYNLSSRSPAHSECSQSPVISDRFASLPYYPSPSTHLHPIYSLDLPNYPPSIMLSPTPNLQLFLSICPTTPSPTLQTPPLHPPPQETLGSW